jgi:TrmH family RNA methyltransferase
MAESSLGRSNPLIAHIRKLGLSRRYRYERREFVCDGEKLLREAEQSGARVLAVLTCRPERLGDAPPGARVYTVTRDALKSVSALQNPQDTLFTCAMPDAPPGGARGVNGGIIILEGVQDPGNVGTVIRTAAAFGVGAVALTGGCADVYNPKTVRATMGAIFRQSVMELDMDAIAALVGSGVRILAASPGTGSEDISRTRLRGAAIAIGSEGRGLSDKMTALCRARVRIPMLPGAQSLNASAAAAIIMWEIFRRAGGADT